VSATEPDTADFMSGTHGQVTGLRLTTSAILADAVDDAVDHARLRGMRLRRASSTLPRRKVLVLAIERDDVPNLLQAARVELHRSGHDVHFVSAAAGQRGKFENLNAMLADHPTSGFDWLVVIDDDVALPRAFLDNFLFLAERFGLQLAQPAHRHRSHAAWEITHRRRGIVLRETAFVEIGPVFAFRAPVFGQLLPFPALRVGWGLDVHWSAVAREHGWPIGVVDATPIRHGVRPIASSYGRDEAIAEARRFLAGRPYTKAADAQRTLVAHRTWRPR
jgi:hypothetical protein